MTKAQLQQMILLLLVLFVVIWFVLRKGSAPSPTQTPAGSAAVQPAPAAISTPAEPASAEPALTPEPTLARDIFLIPPELVERIRRREQEERSIAEERRKAATQPEVREVIPVQESDLAEELVLQGIFWGVPRPQALINRRILSVGDRINDAEILSITREAVLLSVGGQKIELKPPPVIRPNEEQQGGGGGGSRGRGWSTFNP